MSSNDKLFCIDVVDVGVIIFFFDFIILNVFEVVDVYIYYYCCEGFCGVCCIKLIEGEVEYIIDFFVFIDDDEIFFCCCVVKCLLKIKVLL